MGQPGNGKTVKDLFLCFTSTPVLQYSITPVLQVPRSDDEGYMLRTQFVLRRKTDHVPSYDHY